MIDEYSPDGTGWARFSDDRNRRYRLRRYLTTAALNAWMARDAAMPRDQLRTAVFVLLNPSTADAFKPDPTVTKCAKFAQRWGMDVLEVVNLFAWRSPHPEDLDVHPVSELGIDEVADQEILLACGTPSPGDRIIAAWGNHGWRHGRDQIVRQRLEAAGHTLLHFGLTKEARPLHTLARGKLLIPIDREPVAWERAA